MSLSNIPHHRQDFEEAIRLTLHRKQLLLWVVEVNTGDTRHVPWPRGVQLLGFSAGESEETIGSPDETTRTLHRDGFPQKTCCRRKSLEGCRRFSAYTVVSLHCCCLSFGETDLHDLFLGCLLVFQTHSINYRLALHLPYTLDDTFIRMPQNPGKMEDSGT